VNRIYLGRSRRPGKNGTASNNNVARPVIYIAIMSTFDELEKPGT